MSNSVRPHRWQPARLSHPWDSPGKNTGVGCHFLLQCIKVKGESEVAQSCLTLSDPMDCSLPGSSVHGIFQARVLEWGAIAFSDWISDSSAFSTPSLNIWKSSVNVLLKPSLENFEHYFSSMWNECNCVVVWTLFPYTTLFRSHGLQPTRLLRAWDFPGKSTGVGCHCLLWLDERGCSKSQFTQK